MLRPPSVTVVLDGGGPRVVASGWEPESAPPPRPPITFKVPGVPQPQGSKRHVGGGRMIESSAKLRPWRDRVVFTAREALQGREALAAAVLTVTFRLPRPASVSAKRRPNHTVKPDLDKLIRAVGDALTEAGVVTDDAVIHSISASKVYVDSPADSGVTVVVLPS